MLTGSDEKDSHAMEFQFLGDDNRYEVQEPVGRGLIAEIYRGRDTVLHREVAIKVLRDHYSRDFKFVKRFQQAAKAMTALRHPNIVQVYEYSQTNNTYFMVMELIKGTDLRRYLRARGVLDTERALMIGHGAALGLGAMHQQGIVLCIALSNYKISL